MQETVKSACSISYVSEKLGVSRPTLYKYMEQYDSGESGRLPERVRRFFAYLSEARRSEEDVILYFLRSPEGAGRDEPEPRGTVETRLASEPGRVMIMFPESDPEDVTVRILADFDGGRKPIAEYRPDPNARFVTIDRLVSGQRFYYEVISEGTGASSGVIPFEVQK